MPNIDIDLDSIKFFKRNTDAIFTNRGFYYQYLHLLKKWVTNFVNGIENPIYTEVDNDIKEVGNDYVFTQLKCYSSKFSLNSKEIKQSIFDFFITYLDYRQNNVFPVFSFVTNSGITQNEKLLEKWFNRKVFDNNLDLAVLKKKNKEILKGESNKIRQSKLNRQNLSDDKKQEINKNYKNICSIFEDDLLIEDFCRAVHWEFGEQTTEVAITKLKQEIFTLLNDKAFNGRSTEIIFRVLLSEINRCSQETEVSKRCVTILDLQRLLDLTDVDIKHKIDAKFIHLIGVEIEELKERLINIEAIQEKHTLVLNNLKINEIEKTDLTLIPYLNNIDDVIGWNNEIEEIYDILNQKSLISIYNFGGVGKTTFAKKFLSKYRDDFNNVIWLNVEESLYTALVLNELLISNLHIKLDKELTIEQQFNIIVNELDKYGTNNLIILDIQKNVENVTNLSKIVSLRNWKKIILSRTHYKLYSPFQLPHLNFENAKKLFEMHCTNEIDDTVFKGFLEYIEFNNLIIELVAKTIENGFDLTLEFIFDSLKKQDLNNQLLKIDIELSDEESKSVRIFDFILQKFSIEGLKNDEKCFLEYLSLLPSSEIVIEDLILICGKDFYDGNKVQFINWANSLEKKGFIQYENNRKSIRIHKVLQDAIVYSTRNGKAAFASSVHYTVWLSGRLSDGYNTPKESFRFLKYAESILSTIKEEYRTNIIYQPLLMLENEYLHLSSFFFIRENTSELWRDLIERTEGYLGKEDISLASIYNNLALSLNKETSIHEVIEYLKKAIKIFSKKAYSLKEKALLMFITTINNLAQAYLFIDDFENVIKCFNKVSALRKKYNFYNDAQIGVGYTILSELHRIMNDFDQSESLIKEAIKYHNLIPIEKRNDLLLSSYYNKLSEYSLLKNNLQNAVVYQKICVEILESQEIVNSQTIQMYKFLISLAKANNDNDLSLIYENKLELMQEKAND
ncbi:hypothetical protein A1704_03850 [Chryseobacterium cucumeris]|uniref:tetratricopeptide repeat protein n=1 Tax=Chryseobacterium cucumeris TaxID=1813611 RepID=UPI0007891CCE|nr:tetratricopeptide repeat protein [Chryseobacterium cucumeris]KYH07809.1 hypothetical protein A1704_03850 [Chryseobacterium cucumeris]